MTSRTSLIISGSSAEVGSSQTISRSASPSSAMPMSAPYRATACGSTAVFADGRTEKARYDADSHLLELRTTNAAGARVSTETHTWKEGLEQRGQVDYADGRFERTEWTYNSQRRLLKRVKTGWNVYGQNVVEFTYDSKGRLARATGHLGDTLILSDYVYDAQGRLTAINSSDSQGDIDCATGENRCARFTYWPNGKLKHEEGSPADMSYYSDDYNSQGQLIASDVTGSDSYDDFQRAYDASGRLVRLEESFQSTPTGRQALTTTVFDPSGSRERFAEDVTHYSSACGDDCPQTHRRVTRRTTVLCQTQIIALDEWDSDENGKVDARRTHERDSTGRLVHEEYSGTPGLDTGPVRRDFRYSCP